MIAVWRICWRGALGLHDLPLGSQFGDGRWHIAASRLSVVYAASTRALCQLEKRVHCNGVAPAGLAMIRLELPTKSPFLDAHELGLRSGWKLDEAHTQSLGTAWAAAHDSLGLWVPSYVEPAERNLVINPRHRHYEAVKVVVEQDPFEFDPRLFS